MSNRIVPFFFIATLCLVPASASMAQMLDYRADYAVGDSPEGLAIGDLNGDGSPDVVTANFSGGNISVLLSNGDGTFQNAVNHSVASRLRSVAIGDLDGDGSPDLVIGNDGVSVHDVYVLIGNADGTFQSALTYYAGGQCIDVAIDDFDNDGHPDLAVANGSYDRVAILLNDGDGTFGSPAFYAAGNLVSSVVAGDLNGDGHTDLAAICVLDWVVQAWLGNGDGTFQDAVSSSTGGHSYNLAIDDLDGDGNLDIAVANWGNDTVSILLGNGDGTFQGVVHYGAYYEPRAIAIGDLDGDGVPDLAVANYTPAVSTLLGNGDGTFQTPVTYTGGYSYTYNVAMGDLDGDGNPDVAVANRGLDEAVVLLNRDKTLSAQMDCTPSSGTLPFTTQMSVSLTNVYPEQVRRLSARINIDLAGGGSIGNWRAGWTNLNPGESLNTVWGQNLPAIGSLVGTSAFTLEAQDVTIAPFNQPPYPMAGDTASDVCAIQGFAP